MENQQVNYQTPESIASIHRRLIKSEAFHLVGQLNDFLDSMNFLFYQQTHQPGYAPHSQDYRAFSNGLETRYKEWLSGRVLGIARQLVDMLGDRAEPTEMLIFDLVNRQTEGDNATASNIKTIAEALSKLASRI